jgi:Zn-dependent metalloprotease
VTRFERGNLHYLQGRIPVPGTDAASRARSFLEQYGKDLLRLGPNSELRLLRAEPSTGLVAFRQRYRGLPVLGGNLQILTGADGVHAVIGAVMPGDGLDVTPGVDEREVLQLVEKHGGTLLAPPQLAVSYRRESVPSGAGVAGPRVRTPRLVWIIPCVKDGRGHTMVYDAHSGVVLRETSLSMESQAAIEEYDADWNDANQGPTLLCQGAAVENVQAGNEGGLYVEYQGLPEYATAWTHTRRAFVFFYDVFGRVSYDGDDATVYGYNESPDTDNAHWVGWCDDMHWAPGYGSTDVPVHEFTHGITLHTSDLTYEDEPGALNESFSDIMTAVADNDGAGRWLIGEGNINGSGPIRDMENPMVGHYGDFWYTSEDHGGVHRNSGIGNRAAFLLAEGRRGGTQYPVTGIGVEKMGRLMYAAFTSLGDDSNYDDLRNMAVAIADYWATHGLRGFVPRNVCSVRNAFAAVGVDGEEGYVDSGDILGGDLDCDGVDDADEGQDPDGDGLRGPSDNCYFVANPSQTDTDDDHVGDACDTDDDDDGVPDSADNCPAKPTRTSPTSTAMDGATPARMPTVTAGSITRTTARTPTTGTRRTPAESRAWATPATAISMPTASSIPRATTVRWWPIPTRPMPMATSSATRATAVRTSPPFRRSSATTVVRCSPTAMAMAPPINATDR